MKLSMESNAETYSIVDANIWIAYFDITDSLSSRAKKHILDFETSRQPVLLTDFIIQEVVTVLLYKNMSKSVQQFMRYIHEQDYIEIVSIDTELWDNTIQFIEGRKFTPKLSLTDWSLLFLANTYNFLLVTFDKQLSNTSKRLARQS